MQTITPTDPLNALISVPFHNQTIVAIEHDGKPFIAMRPIVENLGLNWASQYVKLTERFKRCVVMIATHDSIGRQQETICLPISKIAGFLYSINASKVKPELRETIIAYQDECDTVLFNYFFNSVNVERHALIEAAFRRHPQWRETADYTQQGFSTGQVATLQGKAKSSVRAMKARIRAAGIDLSATPRLH
jgi:hypothetical protein